MTAEAQRDSDLSVLIPVYNEVDNVEPLHEELDARACAASRGATS